MNFHLSDRKKYNTCSNLYHGHIRYNDASCSRILYTLWLCYYAHTCTNISMKYRFQVSSICHIICMSLSVYYAKVMKQKCSLSQFHQQRNKGLDVTFICLYCEKIAEILCYQVCWEHHGTSVESAWDLQQSFHGPQAECFPVSLAAELLHLWINTNTYTQVCTEFQVNKTY